MSYWAAQECGGTRLSIGKSGLSEALGEERRVVRIVEVQPGIKAREAEAGIEAPHVVHGSPRIIHPARVCRARGDGSGRQHEFRHIAVGLFSPGRGLVE